MKNFNLNGFVLHYNNHMLNDLNGFYTTAEPFIEECNSGAVRTLTLYRSKSGDVEVNNITLAHPGLNIIEKWVAVKNISNETINISRIDSMRGIIPKNQYKLKYFSSSWGQEFEPNDEILAGTKILESVSGRSSLGMHPWFSLTGERGEVLTCSIAWSGNWIIRFEPLADESYQISGGLSNWNFAKDLLPGETVEGVHIIYVYLPKGDIDDTAVEFARWGKKYSYPENVLSRSMEPEWNSWWPYEDYKLSSEVIEGNADQCSMLGIKICTLDAGWFGPHSDSSLWGKVRGDWHKVNLTRFPEGIKALSDEIHAKDLKFGIWCEIEAVGEEAELNRLYPEFIATRDGKPVGYVCMGNPQTVEWAFGILEKLILDYKADWIKLDFNLNPGAGCNRADHGHGSGDGLLAHYNGYYGLLDRIREKYPEVLLENCSSGGLRIDLGILKHTHRTYLSDPDYTEHHLQVFWGATTMVHPSACMHFTWSQSLYEHNVINEPITEDMPVHLFDYYIRTAMTGYPAFSYRLTEFPGWCLSRLKEHIDFYREISKKFIRDADMYRLTGQTVRNGKGDRWNSYIFVTEDRSEALLFVFRLKGGAVERNIRLKGLEPDTVYSVNYKDTGCIFAKKGRELMEEGLTLSIPKEESAEIILLEKR